MRLTEREKTILPFLPVVAMLLSYSWWFTTEQRPKVQKAQEGYRQAVAKQVRSFDLMRRQGEVDSLRRDVAALETQKADLERGEAEMTGTKSPALRHAHNRALNELLERHHLKLVEESPVSRGNGAKLPKSVSEVLGRIAQASQSPPAGKTARAAAPKPASPDKNVQVRSLRFTGRFVDVLAAIKELSQNQDPPGIPIALSMAEANLLTELRQWTMLVWM